MGTVLADGMRHLFPLALLAALLPAFTLAAGCGGEGDGGPHGAATPVRGAGVAVPTVEGPVEGGTGEPFIAATTFDLGRVGYAQAEYFLSGEATAYTNVGPLADDGMWTVAPAETAPYRTRILVYRPIERRRFNGTVLVEWLNVSGGLDAATDWMMGHTELIRRGYAWVGVSAQFVGVEGGVSPLGLPSTPLKTVDPGRYASLVHPGDSFSYDIFSQAAQAVRRPSGADPLGGLVARRVIAAGESQSAFRLVTYINAVHPPSPISTTGSSSTAGGPLGPRCPRRPSLSSRCRRRSCSGATSTSR